ncbi:hypothetical protein BC332_03315 [Capsicum chinense]|nr:hypothetical protein BC332_03315 [Capsicum chinense]
MSNNPVFDIWQNGQHEKQVSSSVVMKNAEELIVAYHASVFVELVAPRHQGTVHHGAMEPRHNGTTHHVTMEPRNQGSAHHATMEQRQRTPWYYGTMHHDTKQRMASIAEHWDWYWAHIDRAFGCTTRELCSTYTVRLDPCWRSDVLTCLPSQLWGKHNLGLLEVGFLCCKPNSQALLSFIDHLSPLIFRAWGEPKDCPYVPRFLTLSCDVVVHEWPGTCGAGVDEECYLVDYSNSHMFVSKIKTYMCKRSRQTRSITLRKGLALRYGHGGPSPKPFGCRWTARAASIARAGHRVPNGGWIRNGSFRGIPLVEQQPQNWYGQRESYYLIKTKHCHGPNGCSRNVISAQCYECQSKEIQPSTGSAMYPQKSNPVSGWDSGLPNLDSKSKWENPKNETACQ